MIFKILPKLSVDRDLLQTYRQTVPQTRPCNSKDYSCLMNDKLDTVIPSSREHLSCDGCLKD